MTAKKLIVVALLSCTGCSLFKSDPSKQESLLLGIPIAERGFDYAGTYCEPVGEALQAKKIGQLYGVDTHALEGREPYRACFITTTDRHDAVAVVSQKLAEAGAPRGTFITMLGPVQNAVMRF